MSNRFHERKVSQKPKRCCCISSVTSKWPVCCNCCAHLPTRRRSCGVAEPYIMRAVLLNRRKDSRCRLASSEALVPSPTPPPTYHYSYIILRAYPVSVKWASPLESYTHKYISNLSFFFCSRKKEGGLCNWRCIELCTLGYEWVIPR